MASKQLKFCVVGDNHGDEIKYELADKFFDWLDDYRPHIIIHGGDNWNFAALRRKASPEERMIAIAPDYDAGIDFANRLFSYGSQRFFTRGNHDERIYAYARDAKDAATVHFAQTLCLDTDKLMGKRRVTMLPYDSRKGVLNIEGIRSIHGYSAGVGAARRFASVYGTCAFNHTHSMEVGVFERWPETSIAYGVGGMLNIDQHYNSAQIAKLRHENGWVYGTTDGVRATYLQAKYKDGTIYAAKEIKAY